MPLDKSTTLDKGDQGDRQMKLILSIQEDERRRKKENLIVGSAAAGLGALGAGFLWLHRRKIAVAAAERSMDAAAGLVRARRKIAAEINRRAGGG